MTEDIFMIFKVNEEETMDVQYAISSLESLVKLVEILTDKFQNQNDEDFNYTETFLSLNEDFLITII